MHGGDGAGGGELIMPYPRRTGGTLAGTTYQTPELIYQPEGTNDLSAWDMPLEVPLTPPSGLPAAPSGYEWGAVRLVVPAHLPQRGFMRLLIDSP